MWHNQHVSDPCSACNPHHPNDLSYIWQASVCDHQISQAKYVKNKKPNKRLVFSVATLGHYRYMASKMLPYRSRLFTREWGEDFQHKAMFWAPKTTIRSIWTIQWTITSDGLECTLEIEIVEGSSYCMQFHICLPMYSWAEIRRNPHWWEWNIVHERQSQWPELRFSKKPRNFPNSRVSKRSLVQYWGSATWYKYLLQRARDDT